MIKAVVFCCAGMSTSLLVKKTNEAAKKNNVELDFKAYSENEMIKHTDVDCVLLGPQIQFLLPKAKGIYDKHNIPVQVINTVDYGMMNGEKILKVIIDMVK